MTEMERLIFEKQRRQCWIDAWCSVASAWNAKTHNVATEWADEALKAFDKRFPAEEYEQFTHPAPLGDKQ